MYVSRSILRRAIQRIDRKHRVEDACADLERREVRGQYDRAAARGESLFEMMKALDRRQPADALHATPPGHCRFAHRDAQRLEVLVQEPLARGIRELRQTQPHIAACHGDVVQWQTPCEAPMVRPGAPGADRADVPESAVRRARARSASNVGQRGAVGSRRALSCARALPARKVRQALRVPVCPARRSQQFTTARRKPPGGIECELARRSS